MGVVSFLLEEVPFSTGVVGCVVFLVSVLVVVGVAAGVGAGVDGTISKDTTSTTPEFWYSLGFFFFFSSLIKGNSLIESKCGRVT